MSAKRNLGRRSSRWMLQYLEAPQIPKACWVPFPPLLWSTSTAPVMKWGCCVRLNFSVRLHGGHVPDPGAPLSSVIHSSPHSRCLACMHAHS